jgi:hypothetical protein
MSKSTETKLTIQDLPDRLFGMYWSDTNAIVTHDGDFWVVDCNRHKRAYQLKDGVWVATTLRSAPVKRSFKTK